MQNKNNVVKPVSKPIKEGLYYEGPEGPRLIGSKCCRCGKIFFPQKRVCIKCFTRDEMEKISLSRRGELYSYTVIRVGVKDFKAPYAAGYVDLPDGIRLFSKLAECEPYDEVLKIGMEMELMIGEIALDREGNQLMGYLFRPAKKREEE